MRAELNGIIDPYQLGPRRWPILLRPSVGWRADLVSALEPHGRDQLVRGELHAMRAVAAPPDRQRLRRRAGDGSLENSSLQYASLDMTLRLLTG